MGFSSEWEQRYAVDRSASIWPWSDVVSYVFRYAQPIRKDMKVLEIGCGAGANIPFFERLGVDYHAIEGSGTAVEMVRSRYPALRDKIVVGDFTESILFDCEFDLVIDRSALTHNSNEAVKRALDLIYAGLKSKGLYIGIDWFSDLHSDYRWGIQAEDAYTYTSFSQGQFSKIGRVHFSDETHLRGLFSRFEIDLMELKVIRREWPKDGHVFAAWNIVARKGGS
jgi:SAM-dependent methyltransferase